MISNNRLDVVDCLLSLAECGASRMYDDAVEIRLSLTPISSSCNLEPTDIRGSLRPLMLSAGVTGLDPPSNRPAILGVGVCRHSSSIEPRMLSRAFFTSSNSFNLPSSSESVIAGLTGGWIRGDESSLSSSTP